MVTICAELDGAYENHETGKQYRLLRELGVKLRDDDYLGIEAITPEACRQHFWNISGEPNDPPLNVAEQVPQQQVNAEMDREPTFEEFVKTLHEMKVSAPGDDEITVDIIETAPIPIQECILRLLVKMWREADNEGEQEHWSPAVHKAVVLMLYKRKGDFRSLDIYRGICLLSMISRVLARLAISRCSKHFENLGIMVNEQWGFRREMSTRDVILVARVVAELSSEWERNLEMSRSAMERAGTWERNAERWEAEHKMFKETQPMLYLADIKKAYPSAPRQPMWDLLKRNGLLPRILAVFRRLHSETSYSVRLRSGDSGVYVLKRGMSSCTLYNVFHNCALEELNRVTPGIRLRCSPSLRCSERTRGGRRDAPPVEETLRCLHTKGFADDTSTIFPAPVREQVRTVLEDRGETVHPGKDEFMTTGVYRDPACWTPSSCEDAGCVDRHRWKHAWTQPGGSEPRPRCGPNCGSR